MIRLALTGEYHLVWSRDPALDGPARSTSPDGEESQEWKDWNERLRIARQTGTREAWQGLLKPGQVPTLFRMRQIPTSVAARLMGIVRSERVDPVMEAPMLAFRTALVGVEQLAPGSSITIDLRTDATYPQLGKIASDAACDGVSLALLAELGSIVLGRVMEPDPLS